MIPRVLVPQNARLAETDLAGKPARRTSSELDARTLVPADLPAVPLDGHTTIPAHLPLESISRRVVVPRDMPNKPLDTTSNIPSYVRLQILESRIAVPKDAAPAIVAPKAPVSAAALPEVVDPDIFNTGEVNLLVKPPEPPDSAKWHAVSRFSSMIFHLLLIIFVLIEPKLFPYHPPTQAEIDLARKQLSFITYLPPEVKEVPKIPSPPNEPSSSQIKIDPRILRKIAPNVEPQPLPGKLEPERVVRDLPDAPKPQAPPSNTPDSPASPPRADAPRPALRLERPEAPKRSGLVLPNVSPGRAIEDSVREGARNTGNQRGMVSGPLPSVPGGGGSGPPTGLLSNGYEMLTPTEGVDFSNYIARMLASVRRNWYAVIPESARLGDKGMVVLQFKILRNGSVPGDEPALVATSGKEPLDRAAISSIKASNPFEPLPPAFRGPFVEFRFIFLYNIPPSMVQ
ncbi:MAG TPA: TonB C-terminal domain-containing protein [Candidatus Acidoferrales bacterium]|nr:TonB C-terminal domain-containing protein [Candidatus Acidoferrales bacterium]